jgi:hypothetical protein
MEPQVSAHDSDLAEAITAAIHDHIAGDTGGMITGFHLVAEYIDADGEQRWLYATAPDQQQSATLGLLHWSLGVAEYEQRRYLDEISR